MEFREDPPASRAQAAPGDGSRSVSQPPSQHASPADLQLVPQRVPQAAAQGDAHAIGQPQPEPAAPCAREIYNGTASVTPADHLEPRSLQWQRNGELASNEVFELVKRLRRVEAAEHRNELWRLSEKP